MSVADVTICIPAWQAEAFIERTLMCARAQTYKNVRILVSIDQSSDGTEAICRNQAKDDPRLDIRVQTERLGWSENANFLLDQVDTEFCFLYFHDDIIEPRYTERLRQTLLDDPDAQSAHCDLEMFGNKQAFSPGRDFVGTAAERLIQFLVEPPQGRLLRSLFRSVLISKGLRFPVIAGDSFWRCYPFLTNLIAAGAARRVPELLYRRWARDGSLTTSWGPKNKDLLVDGQRQSAALQLHTIRSMNLPKAEEELVTFCLYVSSMALTRHHELLLKTDELLKPDAICESFAAVQLPKNSPPITSSLFDEVLCAYGRLLTLEAKHHMQRGDARSALVSFATALSLNPASHGNYAGIARILSDGGQGLTAAAVRQRARMLREAAAERLDRSHTPSVQ
ncbi:MAG TPA: glycosyltransferase family A protein [Xanthobacteraceae bacterium]|nr:glycosyltransferase family A protein [Xanthobacteraceae bacterium]